MKANSGIVPLSKPLLVSTCFFLATCLAKSSILKMETVSSSETLANFYRAPWHHRPHSHRCENLNSSRRTCVRVLSLLSSCADEPDTWVLGFITVAAQCKLEHMYHPFSIFTAGRFGRTGCLRFQEDGGSRFLRNFGNYLTDCTASHFSYRRENLKPRNLNPCFLKGHYKNSWQNCSSANTFRFFYTKNSATKSSGNDVTKNVYFK
jgi:hypothetical protein